MKECHRKTLTDALGRLPQHHPPPSVWEGIELGRLPTYAPPAEVWNGISAGLDAAPEPQQRPTLRRLSPTVRRLAAAAVILLVLSLFLVDTDRGPEVTYAYTQEAPARDAAVIADWNEDEESFTRVMRQIEDRNEPVLNELGYELSELNAAREEVKAILTAYGQDDSVVRQLGEIERERSDVYRQILVVL